MKNAKHGDIEIYKIVCTKMVGTGFIEPDLRDRLS